MSENTYEKLVSKVKEVDYIVGPGMRFVVQDSVKKTHKSELEKICSCSGSSTVTCEEYNLSLLADFIYNLEKQASQNATIGTPNPLALYFKKKKATDFIATDDSGKKYITLTAEGVVLFRDIWNSGREVCYDDHLIPFSKLEGEGYNLIKETVDITRDGKPVFENQATLVKKEVSHPSLLLQNKYGSLGPTDDSAPDESVTGSRRPIKGSYLTGRKS